MKAKDYTLITNFFKATRKREKYTKAACKYSPLLVVAIYFISILFLILKKDSRIVPFVLVPAFDFIFVSILRKILNKPRPYDELDYTPLMKFTKGKGKSFPSRHTASAFIIAIACLYLNLYFGIFMLILALFIGITRVIGGLHYPKDVAFGIILSCILGSLFFL